MSNERCHKAECRLYRCFDPPDWCEDYKKQCRHEDCINISVCRTPYLCEDYEPLGNIKPQAQVVIHRHSDLSRQEYDMLQQAVLRVQYLEKQIKEMSKPKKKPETYGYRGIR